MGIMGLLNKDQNPVVTHAVTSNNKYSDMKNQLSQLVNTAEADYIVGDPEEKNEHSQHSIQPPERKDSAGEPFQAEDRQIFG